MKKGLKVLMLIIVVAITLAPIRVVTAETQIGVAVSLIINVHTKVKYTGYIQDAKTYEVIDQYEYVSDELDYDVDSDEARDLEKEAKNKVKEWYDSHDYEYAMQQASSYAIDTKEEEPHDEIIRHSDGSVSVITYRELYKTIIISESRYINEEEVLKGDINGDGKVTADDAADVIEKFKTESTTDEDLLVADLNNDGKLTADDAALIIEVFKTSK